jgi:hypothetical protein
MAALAGRIPGILKGEDRPSDNAERLDVAQLCHVEKRLAAAVGFLAEALGADPKLGEDRQSQHRYNAACAAALAAAGQGSDDPPPDDAARARFRGLALGWLRAELMTWTGLLESGPPQARTSIVRSLDHWKQDDDLAGLREAEALARLPEAEREGWRALWADVEAVLTRARQAP